MTGTGYNFDNNFAGKKHRRATHYEQKIRFDSRLIKRIRPAAIKPCYELIIGRNSARLIRLRDRRTVACELSQENTFLDILANIEKVKALYQILKKF